MQQILGWVLVLMLCSAAGGEASEVALDARLLEASANSLECTPAQVAKILDELALLDVDLGRYDEAEKHYQRAFDIGQAHPDENRLEFASILQHRADLCRARGDYAKAESWYLRALDIQKAALGENHPQVATTFNHLAELYQKQGLVERAEYFYLLALYIRKAAFGENNPEFSTSLKGLTSIYRMKGSDKLAKKLLVEVRKIRVAAFGPAHPSVATVNELLARIYWKQGNYATARLGYERALDIRKKAFGETHISVALTLNNLALLYWSEGDYARAEQYYQSALNIRKKALGETHPAVANTLSGLAQVLLSQNRLSEALPLLTSAFAISERRMRQEALGFSESSLDAFLHRLHASEQVLYSLVRDYPKDVRVQRLALSAVLLFKGRSIDEAASISRAIYRSLGSPEDRDAFERLRGLRTQLADLSDPDHESRSLENDQKVIKELADKADSLEADLAKRSAPLRTLSTWPGPREIVDRVAASLPKDSALVEFITYKYKPLVPERDTPRGAPGELRYLALVLFHDGATRAVDLGPAKDGKSIDGKSIDGIDKVVSNLRDDLSNGNVSYLSKAQRLHDLVFKPLLPHLGTTRRLLLSPDSTLGLVPFAALHDGHDFLLDSFDFTYLTSGRDLLRRPLESSPSSVVVFADPDFTNPPGDPRKCELSSQSSEPPRSSRIWRALPYTCTEAQEIQRLLPQAQVFLRSEAAKERLLQLPTPGILHIATHGVFPDDISGDSSSAPRSVVQLSSPSGFLPPMLSKQDPLLRYGLVLAPTPNGSTPQPSASIITALELAGLNLWGTQLVVLSACGTGRGEVRLGQGIYGLRRSLMIAGAETVVMSLGKVNDQSTQELMNRYYGKLLAGQGRAAALQSAMRSFRMAHPDSHPHDWAPFIVLGSDAPLRGIALRDSRNEIYGAPRDRTCLPP